MLGGLVITKNPFCELPSARVGVNSIISTPTPTPEVSTPTPNPTPGDSTPTPNPTLASLLNINSNSNSNSNSGGFNSNSNSNSGVGVGVEPNSNSGVDPNPAISPPFSFSSSSKSYDISFKLKCSVKTYMLFRLIQTFKTRNGCLIIAWTATLYRDWRPPYWLLVIAAVGICRPPVIIGAVLVNWYFK